ncbi:MAG: type II toxin-antitoxin system HicB family antitoxin [Chloroflexi bacterium]|nr:type II toxin-antitoxin system HicB family antitoxin [Chloroflexota bacterium]
MAQDTLHLTAVIRSEDGQYVSLCPELGVASCGDTPQEAQVMLKEALELFLAHTPIDEYDYLFDGESVSVPVTVTGLQSEPCGCRGSHSTLCPEVSVG